MRVGWLADNPGYTGGAELNAKIFREEAPGEVDIVDCPHDMVEWPGDIDLYVIHNCVSYRASDIERFKGKPVVKIFHDIWPHGDPAFRRWVVDNAKLIAVSPKVREWTGIEQISHFVPSPVFQPFSQKPIAGLDTCWLGFLHPNKGLKEAAAWAHENKVTIDVYGRGDRSLLREGLLFNRELAHYEVPSILAAYRRFVFLPTHYDACPRTIFEAWLAGCEIITNNMQGASWWIDNDPEAISEAPKRFWELVI